MSVSNSIKGAFVKSMVKHMTDGDNGSTYIGVIAIALLSANIDFAKLFDKQHPEQLAAEAGKAVAAVILGLWAWKTGKPAKNSGSAT